MKLKSNPSHKPLKKDNGPSSGFSFVISKGASFVGYKSASDEDELPIAQFKIHWEEHHHLHGSIVDANTLVFHGIFIPTIISYGEWKTIRSWSGQEA